MRVVVELELLLLLLPYVRKVAFAEAFTRKNTAVSEEASSLLLLGA